MIKYAANTGTHNNYGAVDQNRRYSLLKNDPDSTTPKNSGYFHLPVQIVPSIHESMSTEAQIPTSKPGNNTKVKYLTLKQKEIIKNGRSDRTIISLLQKTRLSKDESIFALNFARQLALPNVIKNTTITQPASLFAPVQPSAPPLDEISSIDYDYKAF